VILGLYSNTNKEHKYKLLFYFSTLALWLSFLTEEFLHSLKWNLSSSSFSHSSFYFSSLFPMLRCQVVTLTLLSSFSSTPLFFSSTGFHKDGVFFFSTNHFCMPCCFLLHWFLIILMLLFHVVTSYSNQLYQFLCFSISKDCIFLSFTFTWIVYCIL